MDWFLDALRRMREMVPVLPREYHQNWNPVSVPLLDYLQVDSNRLDIWSYPSTDLLDYLQRTRGLHWDLRKEVVVKEITIRETPGPVAAEIINLAWDFYQSNQEVFLSATKAYKV